MADTALKFGPEWLRALTDRPPQMSANSQNVPPPPRQYKLADFRYGREEMLALFDHNSSVTDETRKEFPTLMNEICQPPLALVAMSDEEHRLWARSVNSDVVLRLQTKTGPAPGLGVGDRERLPVVERAVPRDLRGGRGGSTADRGRTRGGRGGGFYQRGMSYEEDGLKREGEDLTPERRDFRPKLFESRNPSSPDEPVRERAFPRTSESEDPRAPRGPRAAPDSWRTGQRVVEGGWRSQREDWGERRRGWRDEESQDMRNGQRRPGNSFSRDYDNDDDGRSHGNLPEWSLDDAGTTVGTFDASGAFREGSPEESKDIDDANGWKTIKSSRHDNAHGQHSKQRAGDIKAPERNETSHDSKRNQDYNIQTNDKSKLLEDRKNEERKTEERKEKSNALRQLLMPNENNNTSQTRPEERVTSRRNDEEGFAHLEKAAESMVALLADEEVNESSNRQNKTKQESTDYKLSGELSQNREDAFKWFYRDPQDEMQGPFSSAEMLEWFNAGYFRMDLLVKRGCDERFSQLGNLIRAWERIPFEGQGNPPPLRVERAQEARVSPRPVQQAPVQVEQVAQPVNAEDLQMRQQMQLLNQQQQQRIAMQQQQVQMQNQLRQLLAHLKTQDGFSELSQQEQQEILVRQYAQQVEQQRRQIQLQQQQNIPQETPQVHEPMFNMHSHFQQQQQLPLPRPLANPMMPTHSQPPHSIWDLPNGGMMTASALEEMQHKEQERNELEEKKRKHIEEEHRRRMEENSRKMQEEEQLRIMEMQRQLEKRREEEERKRNEELIKQQKQQDEARRIREHEEEERRIQEDHRRFEEQRRRQEEMRLLDEMARKQKEENERRQQEEEAERFRQLQEERHRLHQKDVARQAEAERQRQQEAMKRLQERNVWSSQQQVQPAPTSQTQSNVSLADIQRIQSEKEYEERLKQSQFQQQQMQALLQAQQTQQQQNLQKQQLTWAAGRAGTPIKTLAEIQKEEADKLAKQRVKDEALREQQAPQTLTNVGIWSNAANQLNWKPSSSGSSPVWNNQSSLSSSTSSAPKNTVSASLGASFWDQDDSMIIRANKPSNSAFSSNKNSTSGNSESTKPRPRKDEEAVLKIFENQRRQKSDEFTQWCEGALIKIQSSVDVPTFVTFLKDIESPFDVNDYVKSYLGESKESRDFAKQFLEKRSFYRNKAKKQSEELMWGPAPAITPSVKGASASSANQLQSSNNGDGSSVDAALKANKAKKKKAKRVDASALLGFVVQADPDRFNAGEIEHFD